MLFGSPPGNATAQLTTARCRSPSCKRIKGMAANPQTPLTWLFMVAWRFVRGMGELASDSSSCVDARAPQAGAHAHHSVCVRILCAARTCAARYWSFSSIVGLNEHYLQAGKRALGERVHSLY